MNKITPLGNGQFELGWIGAEDEAPLKLDFRPLIKLAQGYRYLIHWQARPKGLRRWGVYDILEDSYTCCNSVILGESQGVQVNELKVKTLPTAVLMTNTVNIPADSKPVGAKSMRFGKAKVAYLDDFVKRKETTKRQLEKLLN